MNLPDAIRALRKSRRLTQEGLARKLNRSVKTVANWEQARFEPHAEVCARMAALAPPHLVGFFAGRSGPGEFSQETYVPLALFEKRLAELAARVEALEKRGVSPAAPAGNQPVRGVRIRRPIEFGKEVRREKSGAQEASRRAGS